MAETKYKHIYEYVKQEIINGNYKPNERLPKEQWFSDTFHVSHLTYNKAMDLLMKDGFIVRYPKKGSFVSNGRSSIKKSLSIHESFSKLIERAGFQSKNELIQYSLIKTSTVLDREILCLRESTQYVHYFERLRYANDRPICLTYTFFSAEILKELNPLDLNYSFSDLLKSKGIYRDRSHIEICATNLTLEQQKKLQTSVAATLKQTVYWYMGNKLIEITYNYFISDDFSITQDMELKYNGKQIKKEITSK